jgi:ABC-2 type transport system ATP-binding protein
MSSPTLVIDHLCVRYGPTVAVAELCLQIQPGEIFGLLGPNGSGKSSTLGAIIGDRPVAKGTITVLGQSAADDPLTYRRRIGLVPQELALYEELTAEQNLLFFGRLFGLHGNELKTRVSQVLDFVQLTEQAKRPARTYSGGMQRRLNLGCALLHRPALLLLDEPTVGLDIQCREAIFENLRQLKEQGTALVFTTHHLQEVEQLCDRIAIMDHGQLMMQGTIHELCHPSKRRNRLDAGHPLTTGPRASRLESLFLDLTGRSLRDT